MSFIDDLANTPPTGLQGTDKTFIDADTLVGPDGSKYRLQGIDAPEVEKVIGGRYRLGTAGGEAATEVLSGLANDHGFTNVVPVLGDDGNPQVDQFGRQVIDLQDSTGKSFRSAVLEAGVLGTTKYTNDVDALTSELGQLRREQASLAGTQTESDWDKARDTLHTAMQEEGFKQQGFRRTAQTEAELAAFNAAGLGHMVQQDTVEIRDYGRNLNNESLNPWSDSWEQGWLGVAEGAYGAANLLGESLDIDPLAEFGEAGVERIRSTLGDAYGTTVVDWKEVKDFDTAVDYLANNIALSLPYMAVTVGSSVLPGGLAVTLAAPATIYTGQTWNEMEGDKNPAVAIAAGAAQAALDRLGINIITKGKGGRQIIDDGIAHLVAQGVPRAAAQSAVLNASRKELAGLLGDVSTIAKQQIAAKQAGKQLAVRGAQGAAGEALTEAAQETIAYTGATIGSDKEFDWGDLTDRQIAALIAGGTLGGAFSVPGTAYDVGAWADVAVRQAPAEQKRLSNRGRWAEEEVAEHGRVRSIRELNEENQHFLNNNAGRVVPLDERVAADQQRKRERTFEEKAGDLVSAIPGLFVGSVRHIVPESLQEQYKAARKIADIYGGQLQRVFSGAAFENEKHHRLAVYKNMVPIPDKTYAMFNNGKIPTRKGKRKISGDIYNVLRSAVDADGNFNPDLIPDGPTKQVLIDLQSRLQNLSDRMWADQAKHNPDLGKLQNYLLRYKSFNKAAVAKNKGEFISKLVAKGVPEAEAREIAEAIAGNPNVNDYGEAYSAVKGEFSPGSHQSRTLNLSEDPEFDAFMEQDLFANVSNAAKSAARYTTHQDYVGRNADKLAAMLQQLADEGAPPEVVNKVAAGMKNFLDAESGNYKRAQSKFGKDLEKIQRNFMTWTTLAGLPLAAISSFVEFALTQRALTKDQMSSIKTVGEELGATMNDFFGQIAEYSGRKRADGHVTQGQERIRNLGFYEWDVGAATVTGTTEVNAWQQTLFDKYFKATGLTQWTNFTRALRGTIAMDYIHDKIEMIMDSDPDNITNEVQEAKEALRNIGINVDDMVQIYSEMLRGPLTPESDGILQENLREGMFNFINDAVALPQAANRPLIYQDPRFALFTQFQGFIATFTANHIPKLWGEYVKRGTPSMKYNAFAVMATMIALGFASQYLKDLIKFGGRTPYLEDPEYIQRGIRASGLLGTGERVLDQFFPLYEQRSRTPADWVFNTTTSESPAISNLKRAAKGAANLAAGDVEEGARNLFKTLPVVSPLSSHLWDTDTREWKFK